MKLQKKKKISKAYITAAITSLKFMKSILKRCWRKKNEFAADKPITQQDKQNRDVAKACDEITLERKLNL